ncbi:hypothetical protein LDENG_00034120 [Lucifuga dentata]|nr:hypothetical protein LDENG_00034120 [Lucifuga dentata]
MGVFLTTREGLFSLKTHSVIVRALFLPFALFPGLSLPLYSSLLLLSYSFFSLSSPASLGLPISRRCGGFSSLLVSFLHRVAKTTASGSLF